MNPLYADDQGLTPVREWFFPLHPKVRKEMADNSRALHIRFFSMRTSGNIASTECYL